MLAQISNQGRAAAYVAGAQARAQYSPFETLDAEGNPTTISAAQAIQTGAVKGGSVSPQFLMTGQAGMENYNQALQRIQGNLHVLDDPQQRSIMAHTLSAMGGAHDPGVIQSLLTSGVQNGLSPQGAQLLADLSQAREFAGANRQFAGNMRGSEALYQRIVNNIASPLNNNLVNRSLIQNDLKATANIKSRLGQLTSHAGGNPAAPQGQPQAAPAAGGGVDWNSLPVAPK